MDLYIAINEHRGTYYNLSRNPEEAKARLAADLHPVREKLERKPTEITDFNTHGWEISRFNEPKDGKILNINEEYTTATIELKNGKEVNNIHDKFFIDENGKRLLAHA